MHAVRAPNLWSSHQLYILSPENLTSTAYSPLINLKQFSKLSQYWPQYTDVPTVKPRGRGRFVIPAMNVSLMNSFHSLVLQPHFSRCHLNKRYIIKNKCVWKICSPFNNATPLICLLPNNVTHSYQAIHIILTLIYCP